MTSTDSSISSNFFDLKENQRNALLRMLQFNRGADERDEFEEDEEEEWKLLIYDEFCRDLIAPLLRVGDLRQYGVTLHMMLHSDREQIEEVPAIYFCLPTKENIDRICRDCKKNLYDKYFLNFASSVPSNLIQQLANTTSESGTSHKIAKIFDQYVSFVSLEKDLFSMNMENSYQSFNDKTISDVQAEANVESVVNGLFSIFVTLGVVPIIRCPRNGSAEAIATQLDTKLHDHLSNMNHLFSESTSFHRPVLVLLDRNIDLSVMLNHTWTYQALVHDLLDMKLNKIRFEVESEDKKSKEEKNYALDTSTDSFWSNNVASPFPKIAVEVKTYVTEYSQAMEDFKKKYGSDIDIEQDYDESKIVGRTKDLGAFVTTLPTLREKKKMIDCHTNIAMELLNQIKKREIDTYFSLEEGLITRTTQDKKEILSVLSDPSRGTKEDKLRLFLIYLLSNENIPESDLKQMEQALTELELNLDAAKYVKDTKSFKALFSPVNNSTSSQSSNAMSSLRGFMQKVNVNADFDSIGQYTQKVSNLFASGVKALLPVSKELYTTRIVDAVMELKNEGGVDNYLYFDPKVQKKMRQTAIPRKNTPFKEAIVFVVGGGNYVEYHNLQEYAKKQPTKKIIYGSTEIINPEAFISQLNALGKS